MAGTCFRVVHTPCTYMYIICVHSTYNNKHEICTLKCQTSFKPHVHVRTYMYTYAGWSLKSRRAVQHHSFKLPISFDVVNGMQLQLQLCFDLDISTILQGTLWQLHCTCIIHIPYMDILNINYKYFIYGLLHQKLPLLTAKIGQVCLFWTYMYMQVYIRTYVLWLPKVVPRTKFGYEITVLLKYIINE